MRTVIRSPDSPRKTLMFGEEWAQSRFHYRAGRHEHAGYTCCAQENTTGSLKGQFVYDTGKIRKDKQKDGRSLISLSCKSFDETRNSRSRRLLSTRRVGRSSSLDRCRDGGVWHPAIAWSSCSGIERLAPAFDVTSVRPNDSGDDGVSMTPSLGGNRMDQRNASDDDASGVSRSGLSDPSRFCRLI